jgi:hypothetical protein
MLPLGSEPIHAEPIPGSAKIDEVAARVLESANGITVIDDENRPIGHLTRSRIIEVLFAPARPA